VCIPELPGAEPRLQRRYHQLVVSHLRQADRVAAGLRCPPGAEGSFAATQAAWRFYSNKNVSLRQLSGPLLDRARAGAAASCDRYVLVTLDWSPLHYGGHPSKADRVPLAHGKDLGYDLLTALAVGDRDGSPLAPVSLELRAADGVHSTRSERLLPGRSKLDCLGPVMGHAAGALAGTGRQLVFIIDREADSVGHYRRWHRQGRLFVVRADDRPRAVYEGEEMPLGEVADRLQARAAFADTREVVFKGKPARQFVAEAEVVLRRPARTHRVDKETGRARHRNVPGKPITLRLVVSEVRDETGAVLARWLLLTNLPGEVKAATVALWYYWRWRIESYHKLLKGASQHLEAWQQESAPALARRLTVSAMAAVAVWELARDASPEAGEMREVLVRLSGRQMKRGRAARGFTEPALMAGLGVLVPMLLLLEHHDLNHIRRLARLALPPLSSARPAGPSG
jgi:hypothetical protein